jgi:hypothetical protein
MSKPRLPGSAFAWLSGQTPPKHEDNEQTIGELRARIQKTVAFAESVKEAQYAGARERKVKLYWAPGKVIGGEDYLLQMTIPNTFFHIAMAYAVLRHNGVDVDKIFSWSYQSYRRLIGSKVCHANGRNVQL